MEKIPVRHIMTSEVHFVGPNALGVEIKEIFDGSNFHHIPVVDDRQIVVGIISRLDYNMLLDHFTIFSVERAEVSNRQFLSAIIASEIMRKQVSVITAEDDMNEVARIFLENLIHCLPVVDKSGKLVGIVTAHDVLKYYHEHARQLALKAGTKTQ